MDKREAVVGTRVRSLREFSGVPKGTEGVIDEDYGSGVMVAWDLPDSPLPKGYKAHDGKPAVATGILRDGFDKDQELVFLEKVYCLGDPLRLVLQTSGGIPSDQAIRDLVYVAMANVCVGGQTTIELRDGDRVIGYREVALPRSERHPDVPGHIVQPRTVYEIDPPAGPSGPAGSGGHA